MVSIEAEAFFAPPNGNSALSAKNGLDEMMEKREKLRALAETGVSCTIERNFELDDLNGYIVSVSDEYVAIESFYDFHSQGLWLTQIDDVQAAHVSANDEFVGGVIEKEGLRRHLPPAAALSSPSDLAAWAQKHEQLLIFEVEFRCTHDDSLEQGEGTRGNSDDEDEYLYLGRVVRLREDGATIRCIKTDGVWEEELTEVEFEDFGLFRAAGPYSEMFAKHGEPFPAASNSSGARHE